MKNKVYSLKSLKYFLLIIILIVTLVFLMTTIFPFSIPYKEVVKTFGSNFVSHAPRIKLKDGTSSNWAGYAVEINLTAPQNNAVSDVKGQWIVPTAVASSSPNAYSAIWVGIDGYSDSSVEQIGTEQNYINGKPYYYAWYEMYPKPSNTIVMTINPGDTISAEVKYIGSGNFLLTLQDITTGKSFSTTQKSNKALRQSAEWIVEAPWSGGVLPLANFGTAYLSNSATTLNNQTGTISNNSWQNDPITMASTSGTIKAAPSALSSDGSSFSVKWYSN
ncbi:MAG: G1 family endopeptidase [Actinobacteria bacterium]|nr:G1 family endopeptidase [Actinomycetota bacterium]